MIRYKQALMKEQRISGTGSDVMAYLARDNMLTQNVNCIIQPLFQSAGLWLVNSKSAVSHMQQVTMTTQQWYNERDKVEDMLYNMTGKLPFIYNTQQLRNNR